MAHVKALGWLRKNYIVYESLQCATVMAFGDIIAQKIVEKKEHLEKKRTITFSSFGLFFSGPVQSTWFHYLDAKVPAHWPFLKRGVTKMALDQIIMGPFIIATVVSYLELTLGSGTIKGVKEEMDKKYLTILINSYKVWPAVQMLNFSVVPVRYQVLVLGMIAVAWNAYVSTKKNRKE